MKKDEQIGLLLELYCQYYARLKNVKTYKKKFSNNNISQVSKFIDYVNVRIGDENYGEKFIGDFLTFSFGSYSGRKDNYGRENTFPLSWIISRTKLDEFLTSNYRKKYVLRKKMNENRELGEIKSTKQKEDENKHKKDFILKVNTLEERDKERFLNTNKGFVYCSTTTTLINPASDICNQCKYSVECKNLLREEYSKIFKVRFPNG